MTPATLETITGIAMGVLAEPSGTRKLAFAR